ncbi:MAG: hypothetical protein ACTSRA_00180 [Promethearchaeota archaeon]
MNLKIRSGRSSLDQHPENYSIPISIVTGRVGPMLGVAGPRQCRPAGQKILREPPAAGCEIRTNEKSEE